MVELRDSDTSSSVVSWLCWDTLRPMWAFWGDWRQVKGVMYMYMYIMRHAAIFMDVRTYVYTYILLSGMYNYTYELSILLH